MVGSHGTPTTLIVLSFVPMWGSNHTCQHCEHGMSKMNGLCLHIHLRQERRFCQNYLGKVPFGTSVSPIHAREHWIDVVVFLDEFCPSKKKAMRQHRAYLSM